MNLVTVIIPCFNDGLYIDRAVASVLNQSFIDFRIIIIDDGSDKVTKTVLNKIKDERITVIYQKNNGVSHARNSGIKLSKSEYIMTLDADDYYEPRFLEMAVAILKEDPSVKIVGSYYKKVIGKDLSSQVVKPHGGSVEDFLLYNSGVASSLYRRVCWEQIGGYDELMLNGYEDWEFWISILKNGGEMKIIEESLFNYRIKKESRDQVAIREYDFELKEYIFKKHFELYRKYFDVWAIDLIKENCKLNSRNSKLKTSMVYKISRFVKSILNYFILPIKVFNK